MYKYALNNSYYALFFWYVQKPLLLSNVDRTCFVVMSLRLMKVPVYILSFSLNASSVVR